MMVTIKQFADYYFSDEPCLLRETPSGEKLLWLTPTNAWKIDAESPHWAINDFRDRQPIGDDEDADEVVRSWLRRFGDTDSECDALAYAGCEIGQCTKCERWMVVGQDVPELHYDGCSLQPSEEV